MKNLEIQLLVTTGLLMLGANLHAGTLSDPSIDSYNVRLGTQTFGSLYKFTTNTMLVETAQAIRSMGSDVIKFYLGSGFSGQYGITLPATVTNLMTEAKLEPSCRAVLDMPFRHFLFGPIASTARIGMTGSRSPSARMNTTRFTRSPATC